MLKIYNSISNQKEIFKPQIAGEIGIYVCGMTVYDLCHLGHARTVTAFDVIIRFLRSQGYKVTYVRNITDVDDKIINKANQANIDSLELANNMIVAMETDFAALGNLPPDHQPRATEYINAMIEMIEQLITKDYAYAAANGDVYYRTTKFANYGQLSGKVLEELAIGHRIQVDQHKQNPQDFVLWKNAKTNEPSWSSPWGNGRPGWHIECSAMAKKLLGNTLDIHCGGMDLKFPHHENEIAQSEACNNCKFANYWMHTGAIRIDNVKMSKSLGNFFTIRDILKEYNAEAVRFFLISSHYRSPINYTTECLNNATTKLTKLYSTLQDLTITVSETNNEFETKFINAMNDDFNTAEAIAVLFEIAKQINIYKKTDVQEACKLAATLKNLANVLGILQQQPQDFLQHSKPKQTDADEAFIIEMIDKRNAAKQAKDFALADTIRQQLEAKGIILQDSRTGTTWRQK